MSEMIRQARKRHGLTIYELATRLSITAGAVSQIEKSERDGVIRLSTLQKALGVLGEEVQMSVRAMTMSSRRLMSARAAAASINAELELGDTDAALRLTAQAIEHFRLASTSNEIADFLRKPTPIADARWNNLLATAVRWDAQRRGIAAPEWTRQPPLEQEWMPGINTDPSPKYKDYIRANAEPAFLAQNILMRERDLGTPPVAR